MKIIRKLSEMIEEELNDAEKYAKCALKHKDDDPSLARVVYQLSEEELTHMRRLHDEVVRIITDFRDKGNDTPPEMQGVYDYLHERQIEHASKVKNLQAMYREN